jgi:hypothetical protein
LAVAARDADYDRNGFRVHDLRRDFFLIVDWVIRTGMSTVLSFLR